MQILNCQLYSIIESVAETPRAYLSEKKGLKQTVCLYWPSTKIHRISVVHDIWVTTSKNFDHIKSKLSFVLKWLRQILPRNHLVNKLVFVMTFSSFSLMDLNCISLTIGRKESFHKSTYQGFLQRIFCSLHVPHGFCICVNFLSRKNF